MRVYTLIKIIFGLKLQGKWMEYNEHHFKSLPVCTESSSF